MSSEPIFRGHEQSLPTGAPEYYTPKPPHKPLARPLRYLLEEQRLLFALVGMVLTSAVLLTAPSSNRGGGAVATTGSRQYGGHANAALGAAVGEQERRAALVRLPLGVRRRRCLRVVVTGGAGFVGSHLVDRLLERGDSVVVVDNFFTGRKENLARQAGNPELEVIRHDVVEPILLEVDRIYHLACPASPVHYKHNPVKTIKTNVMGTLNMLGLAKRVGARFLLTSTSEVYGDPLQHPQVETYWGNVNPIGVRSCYDEGKRTAETLTMDYHRAANLEVRIARIFNTYGPRMCIDDGRVVSNFVAQALRKDPLTVYGDGKQTRSFQYVSDLDLEASDAGPMASEHRPSGARNAAPTTSIGDLASMILKPSRAWASSSLAPGVSKKHKAVHVAPVAGQVLKEKAKLSVAPPARSQVGVESSARLVSGGNCARSGVLPPEEGVKTAEELGASFSAPDLEMDLTEVPEDKLLEAVNTHAMDIVLLSQAMQKQQHGWRADLEKKIEKLEADLSSAKSDLTSTKTALAKEVSLREKAQDEVVKAKEELKTSEDALQEKYNRAIKRIGEEAQRAVDALLWMVQGVEAEVVPPEETVSLRESLRWLANELEGLEGLMDSGREFVCLETLRAFAASLRSAGCEHLGLAEPKELKDYWTLDSESNAFAEKFFDNFWLACGRDLALLHAALSGSQDAEEIKLVKAWLLEFIKTRNAPEASSSLWSPSVQPPPAPASTPEAVDPPHPEGQNASQNSSAEAPATCAAPGADAPDTHVV